MSDTTHDHSHWRSSMSAGMLRERARLLANLRQFFARREVMEVEIPVLGARTVTDPFIEAIACPIGGTLGDNIDGNIDGSDRFLQSSPEYFMKRLLADGAPSIYCLGKAFREGEIGKRHNPEFTMLEWYRLGFDDRSLMLELEDLLATLDPQLEVQRVSYAALFDAHFHEDPHRADANTLAKLARQTLEFDSQQFDSSDKNLWLDLLFSHVIEPSLQRPTIVYDYPASQCALARVAFDENGSQVAKRFELFWKGTELANGYWELADAKEQRRRFEADIGARKRAGHPTPALDEKFLSAMLAGLPDCAGIALGVDRLFMCIHDLESIDQAIAFPQSRL